MDRFKKKYFMKNFSCILSLQSFVNCQQLTMDDIFMTIGNTLKCDGIRTFHYYGVGVTALTTFLSKKLYTPESYAIWVPYEGFETIFFRNPLFSLGSGFLTILWKPGLKENSG